MSANPAVVEIQLKARNLADAALKDLAGGLDKVAGKAGEVAGKVTSAFRGIGNSLANAIGNSVENLTTGGDLGPTLLMAGGYMAGQLAEQFGGQLIERLAGSALIGAIAAPLGALGSAIGSIVAAAIPIGMALLPVILIGALVAAVAVLVANPEIRGKVIAFVTGLVNTLVGALGKLLEVLPSVIGAAFGAAWTVVVDGIVPIIAKLVELWLTLPLKLAGLGLEILQTIVRGLAGLPGAVANLIGDAFRNLSIDVGPFHIRGGGITIDLPKIDLPHFAGGVQGFGGGLAVVGERGPEVVRLPRGTDVFPTGTGPSSSSSSPTVSIVGVSERELVDMVERGLYFRLQLAAPTAGPS